MRPVAPVSATEATAGACASTVTDTALLYPMLPAASVVRAMKR